MARAPERFNQDPALLGRAELVRHGGDVVEIYYKPSQRAFDIHSDHGRRIFPEEVLIARFDAASDLITTWPIFVTMGTKFLKPRYGPITQISFEGYRFDLPETADEASEILGVIPDGFNTVFQYGLGVIKRDAPLIAAAARVPKITGICVSRRRPTSWEAPLFTIGEGDLDHLHQAFRKIADRYTRRSLAERSVLAHNTLLTRLDPQTYPEKKPPYAEGAIAEFLSVSPSSAHRLGQNDRRALIDEVGKRRSELLDAEPAKLLRLQRNIEIVNLDRLIERFEALMELQTESEKKWQALFHLNPFIINMLFGHPVVDIRREATVAPPLADGSGAKIVDFLARNPTSNGAALVELKTPNTTLLAKKPYRGRDGAHPVYGPSAKLTGAIAQVLDQKQSLIDDVAGFQKRNGSKHEAFGVTCIVVAGRTPESAELARAFELFRSSLHQVKILTFDEVLDNLRGLRELLSSTAVATPTDAGLDDEDEVGAADVDSGWEDEEEDDDDEAWG